MPSNNTYTQINLTRPPEERWKFSNTQIKNAIKLADYYYKDLASATDMLDQIETLAPQVIPNENMAEMKAIASLTDIPLGRIILCNSYYDLIKPLIGCTAFAFDGPDGPIHARNLDWWTENNLLGDCSELFHFTGAPAGDFYAVSWAGYTGVLSGIAPNRFAISLNAVISPDPFELATPICLKLREAFETCKTYQEAISFLQRETFPADCLLLVSGPNAGEYCVIERTPKRQVTRNPQDGLIAVTNDFRALDIQSGDLDGSLQATSDGRYNRICELANKRPKTLQGCVDYLSDDNVFMQNMTVQQMAFCVATGEIFWRRV